jgi:hypothetical protein
MAETTNLKLQKPVDNDTTWGDDYRGAMDILDEHPGIKLVIDAAARLALTPWKGQVVCQLDTATLYKCTNDVGPVWDIVGGGAIPLTTKGDLLTYDTAATRLGVGTNGQVLTADSTQSLGVKWASAPGSSGVPERWYAPGSADEGYDDEFDDGGIAGWTAVDVAGKANVWYEPTGLKGLSGDFPSGKTVNDISGQLKSLGAMAAPCYIETAVKIVSPYYSANYPSVGLVFADGVTVGAGKQVYGSYTMGSWSATKRNTIGWAQYTGYDTRGDGGSELELYPSIITDRMYLRLAWTAANKFRVYFSIDGVCWYDASGELSFTITPTYFGIIQTANDNNNVVYSGNWAYFRARAGAPANG